MAQAHRMMNHYDRAWSIYQQLLNKYIDNPAEDDYSVFYEIAVDMPYVESEHAMEVWYPNIFKYLEYIHTQCQAKPADKVLFRNELIERYRALGHAYWFLVHDKQQTLRCYERWQELLEEDDQSLGEVFMYLAHTDFADEPLRAKNFYEQAIVELSISEEMWSVELAICYSRLGCLQKKKRFFVRCFYLLAYIADLATLRQKHLEEVGECYLYLAKSYDLTDPAVDKTLVQQYYEQAIMLFLNVKPPTSSFREMLECAELLLLSIQANDHASKYPSNISKQELLQSIYNEEPVIEVQLYYILTQTLRNLTGKELGIDSIMEATNNEDAVSLEY